MKMRIVGLWIGLGLVGCAGAQAETKRAQPDASDIYRVGEARYAVGEYDQAVQLWRHALLELPQTAEYDELRHKLILRMAHGQLMAWSKSANSEHLHHAKQMLDRYLERHVALRGDGSAAEAERGEVYELLYEVESRLPAEAEVVAQTEASAGAGDAEPEPASEPEDDPGYEQYESDGYGDRGTVRQIVVERDRPSVDDPEIMAKLHGSFFDPFSLDGMGAPQIVPYSDPRPMLRRGIVRADADDAATRRAVRRLATSVLAAAHDAMSDCFAAANARSPGVVAHATLGFTVAEDGTVREATIAEGRIVDTLAELCVLEALENTSLEGEVVAAAQAIAVPMTMWMSNGVVIDEANGRTFPVGHENLPFNGRSRWKNPTYPQTQYDSPELMRIP